MNRGNFFDHFVTIVQVFMKIAVIFVMHELQPDTGLIVDRLRRKSFDNGSPDKLRFFFVFHSDDGFKINVTKVRNKNIGCIGLLLLGNGGCLSRNIFP